ncbi:polyprenyl synthetase family protein [Rubrivirga sp. IMCC43871]|uniref:polyprenyl synthetase family protein n=1 Tax=Rubrivirga sp. IMCC43871 TaxID=3391575 RepID=UPI003990332E
MALALPTLDGLAAEVDAALTALDLPAKPTGLYDPVRYVLAGGGKRIRPALVLLAAEAFGGDGARAAALPAALGVEVFHNFTLVHDDIMDGSPTRRGRETVHERWDVPTAILAGDLMMGLAARLVVGTGPRAGALAEAHYRTVARLCEGQSLDMGFETRDDVTVEAYLHMIDGKTGALLEHALEVGGLLGGADDHALGALRTAGRSFGRAFQIQDDLLDVTGGPGWGKPVGADLTTGKRAFPVLAARDRAEAEDEPWLAAVFAGGLPPDRVDHVRERLDALGVLAEASERVHQYTGDGRRALADLPATPAAHALRDLALGLATRSL